MATDLIASIVEAEIWFPGLFADTYEREWGVLFATPSIPDSHDGNHACVVNRESDPGEIVREIVAFYEERALVPRVYFRSADGDHPALRAQLENAGFALDTEDPVRMYLWKGASRIVPNPEVTVRLVERVDDEMLEALCAVENLRAAKIAQRRASLRDGALFYAEIAGEPASMALVERVGDLRRVDEVHTCEAQRGKGCARALIHAAVAHHSAHYSLPLYLWTTNPVAERVYTDAGFAPLAHSLTTWYAWRETNQP